MIPERRGENRPFASLTSGLLARKGQAKPAMKPQGYTMMSGNLDDLGWNDMGLSPPPRTTPVAVPMQPPAKEALPPVVRQRDAIAEALDVVAPTDTAIEVVVAPIAKRRKTPAIAPMPEPVSRAKPGGKGKAAFTLRLDPERHLRLRLACAVEHRSAQAIVTDALDAYLDTLSDIDARLPSARQG